jgi:hypothetical protein
MKKLLLLFLLIESFLIQAQIYNFDYALQIVGADKESKESIGNTLLMINSKDSHYDIKIEEGTSGILSDYNQNTDYRFHLKKLNDSDYIFTGSFRYKTSQENIGNIEIEKIEENKYKIKCSRNNLEIVVTLRPAESDIIRFYYLDFYYYTQTKIINALKDKIGSNRNYYISEYTIKDNGGFPRHYKVEEIGKVNVEVINPLK